MHKPSDLRAVGPAGSHEAAIAAALLALCSTKVLLGQTEMITDELSALLGLSESERAAIGDWAMHAPGRAGPRQSRDERGLSCGDTRVWTRVRARARRDHEGV